jgi:hypothetical protein
MRNLCASVVALIAIEIFDTLLDLTAKSGSQSPPMSTTTATPTPFDPGMGDLMNLIVQPRHLKLWLAGSEENWPLAEYEIKELRAALASVARSRPRFRDQPVGQMIDAVMSAPWRAQQGVGMRRIGVLMAFAQSDLQAQARVAAFREGLQKLGWAEGSNIRFDIRWAPDVESMQRFAKELIALQPELIFSSDTPTTAALLQQTRAILIVFATVSDPVGSGFGDRVARFAVCARFGAQPIAARESALGPKAAENGALRLSPLYLQ